MPTDEIKMMDMQGVPMTFGVVAFLFCVQAVVPGLDSEAMEVPDAQGHPRKVTQKALTIGISLGVLLNVLLGVYG